MPSPKWWQYIINPIGSLVDAAVNKINDKIAPDMSSTNHESLLSSDEVNDTVSNIWDDLTGKSAIELQNKLDREMAEEEYQRNIQAIGDTAAAYEAAGYNRNLLYGSASPTNYQAPRLQQYSGSAKLDTILSRVGKVLGSIPMLYQASAALEGIDQSRERTKQSEIKTMSMGIDLLSKGYRLGDLQISRPFIPNIAKDWFSSKRHFNDLEEVSLPLSGPIKGQYGLSAYKSAALKNQFALLDAIGLKNSLTKTRSNYLGYQYDLDRRFGAAGRIVGMTNQSLGSIAKLLSSGAQLKKPKGLSNQRVYYPTNYNTIYH